MNSFGEVLDRLEAECEQSNLRAQEELRAKGTDPREDTRTIHLRSIQEALGTRSFGPILVVAGVFCITPVGVVPGVPTTLSLLVLIVSVQHVMGRESLWLPEFLLERELKTRRVARSVELLRPVVRPLDRVFRRRITWLVEGGGARVVGVTTMVLALLIPPLEFIPFSVTIPALSLAGFGLGIVTRDGLLLVGTFLFVATALVLLFRGVVA